MGDFVIVIKPSALKQLDNIQKQQADKISDAVDKLANDPFPPGCKKLTNLQDTWRIRVGDYRIIYLVDKGELIVLVIKISHCKEAYK